jgi:hypothetical protein
MNFIEITILLFGRESRNLFLGIAIPEGIDNIFKKKSYIYIYILIFSN